MKRYGGDESKKDIHERDTAYLARCREAAMFAAEKYGWTIIPCSSNDIPRSISDINADIMNAIKDLINA